MKKISYQLKKLLQLVILIVLTTSLSACYNHNQVSDHDVLYHLEELIWQNPDSAATILHSMRQDELSVENKMYWNLLNELLESRFNTPGSPDSVLCQVIDFYDSRREYDYVAKAYYIRGIEYMTQLKYTDALLSLKEAENRVQYLPDSLPYKCLIFFAEGVVAESEYLFHIACDCYQQALDHAILIDDQYRVACCYYNIARTRTEYTDSISHEYYQKALDIVQDLQDTLFYYEILIHEEHRNHVVDSIKLYGYAKYLMDKYQAPFYAHIVVEYLQNHGQMDEAQEYLDFCAQDTSHSAWSNEHFHYLLSRQLYLTDQPKQAFHLLETLYLDQTEQIFRDGKAKTYTISRMYDLEQEKNSNLQLRMEKQHLWITLGVILAVLAFVILTIFYLLRLHKQRTRAHAQALEIERLQAHAAEAQAKMEIERLNVELEVKRRMLLESLRQRIRLSKDIAQSSEGISDMYPQWMQDWLMKNTFSQGANISNLLREFNMIYGHLLTDLKKKYTDLTEKDLQYIALAVLGLNINDICFILGTSERTIWNRRQAIKNRIGDSKMDFDEWIYNLRRVPAVS